MILFGLFLFASGAFLSAFFSGSETGFYRASRFRVVLSALDGDRIAKRLLWLINNPSLFVATTLIGNNVANYLTSLAIVLLARSVSSSNILEMVAPVLMSPLLFVYGELMPKNLFYQAPNRLLRFVGPLFLCFSVLFAPAVAVLWALSKVLEKVMGQAPDRVRQTLARKELGQLLEEGMEVGLLQPAQRQLNDSFAAFASTRVGQVCTPIGRAHLLPENTTGAEVIRLGRRKQLPDIAVYRDNQRNITGYVRTIDALLGKDDQQPLTGLLPLSSICSDELVAEALLQMQAKRQTLVKVVNRNDKIVGLLSIDQLTDPLLQGRMDSLRR